MAQVEYKPIPKEDKVAVLTALENYKKQNPAKYEAKKAELFKRYGIESEPVIEEDANDIELKTLKAKAKK